jgi:hypothetical protein
MGLRRLAIGSGELARALAVITRVPALALMAVAITIVFVVLAPIFLLALAV